MPRRGPATSGPIPSHRRETGPAPRPYNDIMTRRILVLFPDEWDRAAALDPAYRGRYDFRFEGFDLFRFPDNARLFTFDALAFVEKVVRKYRDARLDAVVTSDEQFGPFLAALVCDRLGLPAAP